MSGFFGAPQNGIVRVLWKLIGANMNSTADQAFTKVGSFNSYIIVKQFASNGSISLTTAAGGAYTAASKGGLQIMPSSTTYSAITGADPSGKGIGVPDGVTGVMTAVPILSLTTPQGSAATADLYILGCPVS